MGPAFFRDLRAHALRQGLLLVGPGLPLLDAAVAIATDDAPRVETWLANGKLSRPTHEQLEAWDTDLDKRFEAVVVQPFALAQELAPDA